MNRRTFMKTSAAAGTFFLARRRAYPFGQSPTGITQFTVTLPGLGPGAANNIGNYIPVLSPKKKWGDDYYEIQVAPFKQKLHPNIPETTFWGYADATTKDHKYLGGVIVAPSYKTVNLRVINKLPATHILPVDPTAMDPLITPVGRPDRIAVHIHGGLVHWTSDGGPFAWYSNPKNGGFVHGSSFLNGDGPGAALYEYSNNQSARFLWYHDHAYGITRLNAYAGIASAYLLTDAAETKLVNLGILPNVGAPYTLGIPLIIQDKTFFDPATDPGYPVSGATPGSLWYPYDYEDAARPDGKGRWDTDGIHTPPPISVVPEFFSDVMLVNGAPYPKIGVAPRRYRFRILNGCQARFLNLQLYVADNSADGITLLPSAAEKDPNGLPLRIPTNAPGPRIIQIGTEGGFLPLPVVLNNPPKPIGYFKSLQLGDPKDGNVNRYNLLLGCAERADIIVNFKGFEGKSIILYNDAPAPFPVGDIRNDYYAGAPDLRPIGGVNTPPEGSGPDTRVIMRFTVGSTGSVNELDFNQTLAALKLALPIAYSDTQPKTPATAAPAKVKTLNEDFDSYGRLRQRLGSPAVSDYLDAPLDIAQKGETQIWRIVNLTGDTHPMHFHLVNVQILKREALAYSLDGSGNPVPLPGYPATPGTARGPDPNERGWKETVRMNPGEMVTVIMKFDLPPGKVDPSPRLVPYGITRGAEYVWHCHILEHEEHDMMHALVVTGI